MANEPQHLKIDLHPVLVQADGEVAVREGDEVTPVAADFAELARESDPVGRAQGLLMLPIVVGLQKGTKPVKSMLVEVTRDGVLNEPEDRNAYATAIRQGSAYEGSYRHDVTLTRVGVVVGEMNQKLPDTLWVPLFVLKESDGRLVPLDAKYFNAVQRRNHGGQEPGTQGAPQASADEESGPDKG